MVSFFVYIVRTNTNHLYIGHSDNLKRREWEHRHHAYGAKYLKGASREFDLVYSEPFLTRQAAMRRECQLKGWSRVKKEALIAGDLELLKKL